MKTIAILAAALGLVLAAHEAEGAEKVRKPTVCATYEVLTASGGKVGVCFDSKRPAVFRSYTIVEVTDADGKLARYMLGFR